MMEPDDFPHLPPAIRASLERYDAELADGTLKEDARTAGEWDREQLRSHLPDMDFT
jgi:hypothetical protein